ncbi:hypothetical protein [Maribacter sp. 2-571]|uniref:hypothetical protein n=1 Tax=Maribacter sp. 2-571 TaxID=3417569 RepID=UPI003D34972C
MKTKNLLIIGMTVFIAGSCQKEEETVNMEAVNDTEYTVKYIAENYDNPDLDRGEMNEIADAYLTLDSEQMKEFFKLRGEIMKGRGMDAAEVDTRVAMLLEVNNNLQEETGKSYAQAQSEKLGTAFDGVATEEKYKSENFEMGRGAYCPSGTWDNRGTYPFYRYRRSSVDRYTSYYGIGYVGRVNFGGNSSDCDFLFRSNSYPASKRGQYLVASTSRAINAMRGYVRGISNGNETKVPAKQYYTSSSRRFIKSEVGVGFGRVVGNYPFGGAPGFASEIWVATRDQ